MTFERPIPLLARRNYLEYSGLHIPLQSKQTLSVGSTCTRLPTAPTLCWLSDLSCEKMGMFELFCCCITICKPFSYFY